MFVADKPAAFSPKIALRASVKPPVEMPFKYRAGISASMLGARRIYLGRISLLKLPPSRGYFVLDSSLQQLPGSFAQQLFQIAFRFAFCSLFQRDHINFHFRCILSFRLLG